MPRKRLLLRLNPYRIFNFLLVLQALVLSAQNSGILHLADPSQVNSTHSRKLRHTPAQHKRYLYSAPIPSFHSITHHLKNEMKSCIFFLFILALQTKRTCSTPRGQNSSRKLWKTHFHLLSSETTVPSFARPSSYRTQVSPSSSPTPTPTRITNNWSPSWSPSSPTVTPSPTATSNRSTIPCCPKSSSFLSKNVPQDGPSLGSVGAENKYFRKKCKACCERFRERVSSSSKNRCSRCWLSMKALDKPIPSHYKCRPWDSLGSTFAPNDCFFQRCRMALTRFPWRAKCKCSWKSYPKH